ncbi:hypothetical protein D9M72_452150 [compost metagenome]
MHKHIGPLAAARARYFPVLLALDEQVPAHIQHLGPPAPVLRRLRTQSLHERFQRLVAVGELGVVVRFGAGSCRSRSARGPRVTRPERILDGVLELLRGGRQGLFDVEFQEAALVEVDLGQDAVQGQDAAGNGPAFLVQQVQQGAERFVRALVEELPELGFLRGQAVADDRMVPGFELPGGADRGAVVRGDRRAPFADESFEDTGEALRGGLAAGLCSVQFCEEPGPDLVGQVVQLMHFRDVVHAAEVGTILFQRGDGGVRRRCLAQTGARGFQQRIRRGELVVQRLVFALQDRCGLGAGLVLLPGRLDVGPQRLQVGLGGEGILEPLLDLPELVLRDSRGNLLPGPVVLGDPA